MNNWHRHWPSAWVITLLVMACAMTGCGTGKEISKADGQPSTQQIVVVFHGPEGLKRMPHRYPALRLEMVREVLRNPLTVLFSLSCPPGHLAGHLYKLEQDGDVISARPYE